MSRLHNAGLLAARVCIAITAFPLAACTATAKTIYVDATARSDGNGTLSAPYRTLTAAVSALMPGDTLLIGDGVYRESILLPERKWSEQLKTTIAARHPGKVLIKGSDILGAVEPSRDGTYSVGNWPHNSQQVFVDGKPLQQIEGTVFDGYPEDPRHEFHAYFPKSSIWPGRVESSGGSLPDNSFYYDAKKRILHFRTTADKHETQPIFEASVRPHLLFGHHSHGIHVRGIRFQHANTSDKSRAGAITLRGNGIELEDLEITEVDSVGLNLSGNRNVVRNSVMNYCGQVGLKARGRHVLLEGNTTNHNNTRGFNKWWEAGGAKLVGEYGLQQSRITNHLAAFNKGDGIWFDWGNRDVEIDRSTSAYNDGFGIHYEASQNGLIHHNLVFSNGQRGIYLVHSSDTVAGYNLIAFNGLAGIVIIDEQRRDPKGVLDLVPRNNTLFGNIIAWNRQDRPAVIAPPQDLGTVSDHNLYVSISGKPRFDTGWGKSRLFKSPLGLQDWRDQFGLDLHSNSIVASPEPAISAVIRQKRLEVDWSALAEMASNYVIPYDDARIPETLRTTESARHPGPFAQR